MVAEGALVQKDSCANCEHSTTLFWCGPGKNIPVLHFRPDVCLYKNTECTCNKLASRGVGLTYKLVKTECRLLRQLLEGHGFREIHQNSNDFNVMWCGCHVKPYTLRGLTELQKVNHFPRSYEITRKDRLYKNFMRMRQTMGAKHYDFLPVTFVLPSEVNDFYSTFQREKGYWIAKPVASSRGRGISIISHPNQVNLDEQTVVCKYISNPLLVDGFKFDLRIYVMVTSFDPLRVYIFNEGLARFSTVRYDSSPSRLGEMYMHLTNYSINKKNQGYVKCSDPDIEDYGNKWSMSALLRYLKNEGYDTTTMMMKVEDLIIKTLLSAEVPIANACRMFLPHRENCFELFGFDVIFDEDSKPWLLEVNLSPSLACESPLDLKIKSNLVSHMLTLAGVVALDPYSKRDTGSAKSSRRSSAKGTYSLSVDGTNAAPLSNEDLRLVRQTKEEFVRKGSFSRIFPTEDSWDMYSSFLENKTHYNFMLHSQLYPNRARDKTRPGSAVISMSKFRDMNSNSKMVNYCTIYSGIRDRYSRYEKSLQPLGTVDDYPPESMADTIKPNFSLISDDVTSTTTATQDTDTTLDDTNSVYSCDGEGAVRRTIATQTLQPELETKACSPDTIVDTPDIPTDARPLADILNGIRRGCLRPLSFPECYHAATSPDHRQTSYDRHTSVFTPTYSAFNPSTQSFELPLSRRERVEQYSLYVDKINRSSSKVNLIDVKCSKNNLRLLPNRPRSGDRRDSVVVTTTDQRERERPGTLTLRALPPDPPARAKPARPSPGSTEKLITGTDVQRAVYGAKPSYRAPTEAHLSRSSTVIMQPVRQNVQNTGVARSRTFTFGTMGGRNDPSRTYSNRSTPAYFSRSAAAPPPPPPPPPPAKKKRKEPAIGVEIIKQNQLDFGYAKTQTRVPTYEEFLEEQRKAGIIPYSRPSSKASSVKGGTKKVDKNTASGKNLNVAPKKGSKKGKKKTGDSSGKKENRSTSEISLTKKETTKTSSEVSLTKKDTNKSTSEISLTKKDTNKSTSEVSLTKKETNKSTSEVSLTKKETNKSNSEVSLTKKDERSDPSPKHKSTSEVSLEGRKQDIAKETLTPPPPAPPAPGSTRPSSASSTASVIQEQGAVNVSVFTRDNITVSPKDVTVSRTVNKTQTTILVTVPHSADPVFTKTPHIGKVEISLDELYKQQQQFDHQQYKQQQFDQQQPFSGELSVNPDAGGQLNRISSRFNDKPGVKHNYQPSLEPFQPASSSSSSSPSSSSSSSPPPLTTSSSIISSPDAAKGPRTAPLEPTQRSLAKRAGTAPAAPGQGHVPDSGTDKVLARSKPLKRGKSRDPDEKSRDNDEKSRDYDAMMRLNTIDSGYDTNRNSPSARPHQSPVLTPVPLIKPRNKKKQKPTKPSPYGSLGVAIVRKPSKPVRPTTRTPAVPTVEQHTPYGSSYARYRPQGATESVSKNEEKARLEADKKKLSELRQRISMYSSQVHMQASAKARKRELTSSSLPTIQKEKKKKQPQMSSDNAINRMRILATS